MAEAQAPAQAGDATCIFCKIADGTVPAHIVYQDQAVVAFLDVGPVVAGHTLVVPRQHFRNIFDVPGDQLALVSQRLPEIARAVAAASGVSACHLLLNSGVEAMQSVPHLHFHIIPRKDGDGFAVPWPAGRLSAAEGAQRVAAIRAEMARAPAGPTA